MRRREFLQGVAAAYVVPKLIGCAGSTDEKVLARFPQGVLSAEPTANSIVLWTRAAEGDEVEWEIALDADFAEKVAEGKAAIDPSFDRTVHVLVEGLSPRTVYYYRFTAGGVRSMIGRTKTAPLGDDPTPIRIAFASCQDFVQGHFHAWRALEEAGEVDAVVFLGDYIYEYETGSDTAPAAEDAPPPPRSVSLPDGSTLTDPVPTKTAVSLEDYRTLYRTYRSDPNLRAIHQAFPFIFLFDDHEFANDAWRDHANDYNGAQGDELDPARWSAAFRAWYEYNPISGDPTPPASWSDVRAYRSLRFGGVELFLTDQRSFRDDHVVPEGPIEESVGKTIENSPLGSRTFAKKDGFDILEAEARPSMLGAEQKQWLIEGIRQTDARWKVWASQLVVAQLLADLTSTEVAERFRDRFYFKLDHWDGFRSERREILSALADEERFVIFSGDLHGFFVSEVRADYDDPASEHFAAEVTVSSISADPVKLQVEKLVNNNLGLLLLGLAEPVSRFDEILQASNPHVRYSNSASYGVVIAEFGESEIAVRALELDRVRGATYPGVTRELTWSIGSRGQLS